MHVASMFTCHPFFISKPAYHVQNELDGVPGSLCRINLFRYCTSSSHDIPSIYLPIEYNVFLYNVYAYISKNSTGIVFLVYSRKPYSFASISEISKRERMNIIGETCLLICNPLVLHEETTPKHWTFSTSL